MKTVKIAIIGIGAISGIYLENITKKFKEVEILGVCDLVRERAEKAKEDYNIPKIYDTMHDAFSDPEVQVVLNLTRPYEHFEVSSAALKAGKHVYSEKPLGATFEEGEELVKLAEQNNLMLGGAPDTYLGAGLQTCRKLIDDGYIGDVISSSCSLICRGHEGWHPDPAFYYQFGGGPMLDMGPYYITALINLIGGVKGVTGVTKKAFEQRLITSEPHYGEIIDVEVSTHLTGILHFENGAIGTITTTFDCYTKESHEFKIYGTKGTIIVPDPNMFDGPVYLLRPEDNEPKEMPMLFDYRMNSRALGLADMCKAVATGREARANYNQTLHVLEVMTAFDKSSQKQAYHPLTTKFKKADAMLSTPTHGVLD